MHVLLTGPTTDLKVVGFGQEFERINTMSETYEIIDITTADWKSIAADIISTYKEEPTT